MVDAIENGKSPKILSAKDNSRDPATDAGIIILNYITENISWSTTHANGSGDRGNGEDLVKTIDVALAVDWVKRSWTTKVKESTVRNCFIHVGFDAGAAAAEAQIQEEVEETVVFLADQLNLDEPIFEKKISLHLIIMMPIGKSKF